MLVKKIKYTNFEGEEEVFTARFNLNEVELTRLDVEYGKEGLAGFIGTLNAEEDPKTIMDFFEKFIGLSYGTIKASEDGVKHFFKSAEQTRVFFQTQAYNALFLEIMQDATKAVDFFKAIIPVDLARKADI